MECAVLVRLVDIVDGDDGKGGFISEIPERYAGPRLRFGRVDDLLRDVQAYWHAEEVAA